MKGDDPRTEHYSALGPEVGPRRNDALVALLREFDAIVIAGQAKSHCVAWTLDDLLDDVLAERVYLLEDCTSPVVVPGAVDFTDERTLPSRASPSEASTSSARTEPPKAWPAPWRAADAQLTSWRRGFGR